MVYFSNSFETTKGDKIKRKIMINDTCNGGLKMIDLFSFNKSLKTTWVKRYLDASNKGKWKSLFDLDLQNYGHKDIFLCNLKVEDTKNFIEVTDPFLKEILEIWAGANFEHQITTEEHFRQQVLRYNSLVRINNKSIFFKDWYIRGIIKIKHLQTSDNNKYRALSDFSTKHGIKGAL